MQRDQQPDDLLHHWTVVPDEWAFLQTKATATKLTFAVLLKYFQQYGSFPTRQEDVPPAAVGYLAQQLGVAATSGEIHWHERKPRHGGVALCHSR